MPRINYYTHTIIGGNDDNIEKKGPTMSERVKVCLEHLNFNRCAVK